LTDVSKHVRQSGEQEIQYPKFVISSVQPIVQLVRHAVPRSLYPAMHWLQVVLREEVQYLHEISHNKAIMITSRRPQTVDEVPGLEMTKIN